MSLHDSHIRTWRLWNELRMSPIAQGEAFRLWCEAGCPHVVRLTNMEKV